MWIKLEVISNDNNIIYLLKQMSLKFLDEITVSFGKKNATALVKTLSDLDMEGGKSFENPLKIKVSKKLVSSLCLIHTLTYQIKYTDYRIIIGPTIGLLLGEHNYLYCPRHMEKYSDRFGIYDKIGGLICAFSHKSIDWEKKEVYGLYFDNSKSIWNYGKFLLPTAIYRRDFHTDSKTEKKLLEVMDWKMFNSWRFTKFYLYKHVKRDKDLSKYLPPTQLCDNYEQIKTFIDKHNNVILKPTHLSRGRGICIINKEIETYKVFDYRGKDIEELQLNDAEALNVFFKSNADLFTKYLIQKHLLLAKVDGSPFDIRVVMQKEKLTEWKCTGIECRVAAQKTLITNISRGGYALSLDEALQKSFPHSIEEQAKMKEHIQVLCIKLCKNLEHTSHHFAELGMDIAVDEQGNLWIIEVNVFPSFKGFKEMNYETYLGIRHTPILYAAHLAGF